MNIQNSSELMQNQKGASVMAPDAFFEVLETFDGHSLFFSLGTDGVFYLTKELDSGTTGWTKIDLSSSLTVYHDGKAVTAKTFAVSQNPKTSGIDLALAISVEGEGFLYLSLNNSDQDLSWTDNISWVIMPFDDPDHKVEVLEITDIYISQSAGNEFILADILRSPGSSLNYIFRYAIDPSRSNGKYWLPNDLSVNLDGNGLSSCLGRKKGQPIDGIYTFGKNLDTVSLVYTPLWNYFDVSVPPNPVRLSLPEDSTAIASAISYSSAPVGTAPVYTNLFLAAGGTLYYFPWDKQGDGASPVALYSNELLKDILSLYTYSTAGTLTIWGLNEQGQIFYLQCPVGSETDPDAWTYPLPILTDVLQMAFFINDTTQNTVLFAHTRTGNLIQLSQDPVTTTWIQRNIVLPIIDNDDTLEADTFTTQITITQDDNLPAREVPVTITSTSPVTVYINDSYYHLHDTISHQVLTDSLGNLSIMQETQSLGAICYHLELEDGTFCDINPMNKMLDTMGTVKSGADLAAITVTNADGTTQPLVPADTPKDQLENSSTAIQQLVEVGGTMPADGSNLPGVESIRQTGKSYNPANTERKIWGISYGDVSQYREGTVALDYYTLKYGTADFLGKSIKCIAGDVFNWLKGAWDDVSDYFMDQVDNVWNFFIEIGGKLYSFVLNSINTVIRSIEFVFNKIKVFIEDLIKWIGFLFQWKDILRTHAVLKNLFMNFATESIDNIDKIKDLLIGQFASLEERIDKITGLPDIPTTVGDFSSQSPPLPDQNSPQANWGINQAKNNIDASSTSFDPKLDDPGTVEKLIAALLDTIEQEGDIFTDAIEEVKTQIIDQLSSLSVTDIMKRLLGILTNALLSTVENVIITVIDIIKILVESAVGLLDAPIHIPVISYIYKKISGGSQLSFMDLVCLVVAIPSTIVYKVMFNEAPFGDNRFTAALISAPDSRSMRVLYDQNTGALATGKEEKTMSIMLDLVASFGSYGMFFFNLTTWASIAGDTSLPKAVGLLGVANYACYIAPNINPLFGDEPGSPWYVDLNYGITAISLLKTLADVFRPSMTGWNVLSTFTELAINAAWCVPPIFTLIDAANEDGGAEAALNIPTETILSCTGNFAFNAGGMITPFLLAKGDVAVVTLAGMEFCTGVYGAFMVAAAGAED